MIANPTFIENEGGRQNGYDGKRKNDRKNFACTRRRKAGRTSGEQSRDHGGPRCGERRRPVRRENGASGCDHNRSRRYCR